MTFSTLDRLKTRLRNSMADERLSYLVTCSTCPEMVESVNLVNLCNTFVEKTGNTGIRKNNFGKFTRQDFACQEKNSEYYFQNYQQEAGKSTCGDKSIVAV